MQVLQLGENNQWNTLASRTISVEADVDLVSFSKSNTNPLKVLFSTTGATNFSVYDIQLTRRDVLEMEITENLCSYDEDFGDDYRFGFNGQEKVNEIAGTGNHNTALFWEYDTRLGRRWNLDPKPQISISDYSVVGNNPLINTDVLGDKYKVETKTKNGKLTEVNISAKVYIKGDSASDERAKELTEEAKKVFASKYADGVKVNFNITYEYAPNKMPGDLKDDENLLEFVIGDLYDGKQKTKGYIQSDPKRPSNGNIPRTGNNGFIENGGRNNKTILHETGHLLGFDERYHENTSESGDSHYADGGYSGHLMSYGTGTKIHINQYRSIVQSVRQISRTGFSTFISDLYIDHVFEFDFSSNKLVDKGLNFNTSNINERDR
jgi:hypothetical protein